MCHTLGVHEGFCCCLLVTRQLAQSCNNVQLQVSCCIWPRALLEQLRKGLALQEGQQNQRATRPYCRLNTLCQ